MKQKLQQLIDSIESSQFEETIRLELIYENSSILETKLRVPIKLDPNRHYKVALRYFTVYNNIDNIDNTNNVFCYNIGSGWNTINLISGAYEITQIDADIKRQINNNEVKILLLDQRSIG